MLETRVRIKRKKGLRGLHLREILLLFEKDVYIYMYFDISKRVHPAQVRFIFDQTSLQRQTRYEK